MSLRDTIEGARSEVSQASGQADSETTAKKGAQRGSAANAKPAREKAGSVRTVSKDGKKAAAMASSLPGAKKTKEQKEAERAQRRKERETEDYKNQAFQLLLSQEPEYKKTDRVWWILLGIGFVATLASLVTTFLLPAGSDTTTTASIVCLVIAYAFIIASFVFDMVKRRPIRKEVEKKLAGMSQKKIAQLFAAERKASMERNAAKEAEKAAKKE